MLVLIALINTIVSLYYYLLVVKAMYINTEEPCQIETFRSPLSERAAMWVCVAGIIGLGLVSFFYDSLLTMVGC